MNHHKIAKGIVETYLAVALHGDEEHQRWLRDTVMQLTEDIENALRRARLIGLDEAAAYMHSQGGPSDLGAECYRHAGAILQLKAKP